MKKILGRCILLLIFSLMGQLPCLADTFKGKIVNAETGEVLAGASISGVISPQPGWTYANTAETDSTGCFLLQAPTEGRIVLTFSMLGFKNMRKVDYAYGPEVSDTTDMGIIKLTPTALMLKEVEVKGSLPRFTMRGDTIVFHPEAFKLKEGARLEELIKKLPGVYQQDGKLFWNEKPIRLTMNGKNVFGGDAVLGLLPAEAAKKLKLYNRKSELARHTGKDEGDEDHVLDIQVKSGFLDKWYGEVEAGYVTKDRYSGQITAHKLSDHDPQMVFAQANDINRYYTRTMGMSYNTNIDGDGKSQYGSYNYQHNWNTKGTKLYDNNRFDISANLGHSDGFGCEETTTETYFPNADRTFSLKRADDHSHKLTPNLELKLFAYADSVNTIAVSAKATYEKMRNIYEDDAASYTYDPGKFTYHNLDEALSAQPGDALYEHLMNRNRNYTSASSETKNLYVTYAWEHFLGKKGSYKLDGYTLLEGVENHRLTDRKLEYLRDGFSETLWQSYDNPTRNTQTMLQASMKYWLGKNVYVNLADKVTFRRLHDRRSIFADTDEEQIVNGEPSTLDKENQKNNFQHTWGNAFSLSSTMTPTKGLMIMPKLNWTVKRDEADYQYGSLDTTAIRVNHLLEPSIRMKWKMSRERNMDLSFVYHTTSPNVVNTLGFRDTTNPLHISMGNPSLGNSHSHVTTYNYHRMWLRQQITMALSASFQKDIHPLTTLFRYHSATGVYESMPVNVKGGDSWKFGFNYDQGLGVFFRLANQLAVTTAQSYGYMTVIDEGTSTQRSLADGMSLLSLNHQRQFYMDDNFEFSYETEKLKLSAFNLLRWNRYRYSDASYNSTPVYDKFGMKVEWNFKPFSLYAEVADHFRSGYQTSAMNGHKVISYAYLSYRFYKNKCCLSLMVDDLFNKDIYYSTNTMAYQRTETSNEYFHHYLQLSFSYKFDAKAKK